ncbi:hypothetical protein Q9Q99_19680 [Curtobacterium flaccumfaciens]|nr:hypothetical protein Q9Q99_19680 [Curtobacterium flaccumfaciens]
MGEQVEREARCREEVVEDHRRLRAESIGEDATDQSDRESSQRREGRDGAEHCKRHVGGDGEVDDRQWQREAGTDGVGQDSEGDETVFAQARE